MKKLVSSIVTIMLLVSMAMPTVAQAASLSIDKGVMKVGDVVEVKVTTNKSVENIQFDMQFDNTKYEYVNDSATSKLDATGSNLISENVVRVSAFNLNKTKADTVTLKFKAIATGENIPFSTMGTLEIGEDGEKINNPEITVSKINAISKVTVDQYLDEFGNPIPRHPQTGEEIVAKDKKSIGVYNKLIENMTIVPYAMQNSDSTITLEDIKAEFGEITTDIANPVKTGDTFEVNGKVHTVIIYGDVNKDGRITTIDALQIRRNELGTIKEKFNNVQLEAADVENNNKVSEKDALELQKFILGLRVTNTDTVLDRYPEADQPDKYVKGITKLSGESAGPHYIYDNTTVVATIASSSEMKLKAEMLDFIVEEAPKGADTKNAIKYIDKGNGVFEARLYATEPGTYKITTVAKGTEVKDGWIEMTQNPVTVSEYYTVENVKLWNAQNVDVTDNLIARVAKDMTRKVKFYHNYTDKDGKLVERDITAHIDVEKTKMTKTTNYISDIHTTMHKSTGEQIKYDIDGNYESGTGPIDHIAIQGVTVGNDTITIGVENPDGTTFEKDIEVIVQTKAKIKSVIVNGQELSDSVPGSINIYTVDPSIPNVTDKVGNFIYTIVPIKVRDEDGDIDNLIQANIDKGDAYIAEGRTAIIENQTSTAPVTNLAAITKYSLDENGNYNPESSGTQKIDAIGIALLLNREDLKENLSKGITINYEGITGRETVQVNINIDPVMTTSLDDEEKENEGREENNVPQDTKSENDTTTSETTKTLKKAPTNKNQNEVVNNTVISNDVVNTVANNVAVNDILTDTTNKVIETETAESEVDVKVPEESASVVSSDSTSEVIPEAENE